MKSARKIAYLKRKSRKSKSYFRLNKFVLFGFIAVGIFLIFLLIKLNTRYWDGSNKLSFAFPKSGGDVGVTIMDPEAGEVTTIVIPGDTEISVAMNYGTLRIKSVWQLGINEHLGGKILVKTVAKNFSFPVFLWTDELGGSIGKNNLSGLFKFIFFPGSTNIPFGDRISMAIFSLKIGDFDRTEIDMAKSQFVVKQILTDGTRGYKISGEVSGRLTVYFSDKDFSEPALTGKSINVYIIDSTGRPDVSQGVGRMFEVLGGKVVSIDKSQGVQNFGCEVVGADKTLVKKVVNLFGCKMLSGKSDFDLEVNLGSEFAKNF